jgi:hypothetical protein
MIAYVHALSFLFGLTFCCVCLQRLMFLVVWSFIWFCTCLQFGSALFLFRVYLALADV